MFRKVLLCLHCKPDRSSGISHEVWLEESHCMWVIALSLWLNDTYSKVNKNCQKFCSVNQISVLLDILKGEGFFFSYDFFNNDIPHFCLLGRKKKQVRESIEDTSWKLERQILLYDCHLPVQTKCACCPAL